MILLALLAGCPEPIDYRQADLQVDLPGLVPVDAETVRICVDGVGSRSFGARLAGRFALTGIPAGDPVDIVVDVLNEDGELLIQGYADGVEGWTTGELDEVCEGCEPCKAEGSFAAPEEDSWVLAVRFFE